VNPSPKQLTGIVLVLAVAIVAGILMRAAAPQHVAEALPYFTIVVVGSIAATFFAGQGSAGNEATLEDAVRRARKGKRPEPPAGTTGTLARIYDELGDLAVAYAKSEADREARSKDTEASVKSLYEATDRLKRGVAEQTRAAAETAEILSRLTNALGDMSSKVEDAAKGAKESTGALEGIVHRSEEATENLGELSDSVRATVASIEEMTYSIKEVAKNADALSLTAEETSASMNEMDGSIDQVRSNANETARLSEDVALDADKGAEAILKTIGEIYRIKESSQEAVSVIANLGSRIDAIGQIVNVIDDVAEQTNLLALNAAIIAAQAGEQGKGFAVVADEIKELAQRAGASTREITDLIKTVQAESKNAISAVERGAYNVDRGVEVSNEAERALKKILESTQKSTSMVRAIAHATVLQAKGSRQVTDAIGRIAETVQQIAAATAQQARGAEHIMKGAERMRVITQDVERSATDQSENERRVATVIRGIAGTLEQMSSVHRAQTESVRRLVASVEAIENRARADAAVLGDLERASEKIKRAG
jgi:methyl-accepting chemotaxis protein